MFKNREYQRRAARLALAQAGLTCVPDRASGFYRPARRPDPRPAKSRAAAGPEQLKLNFYDSKNPLADLFGDA